MLAGWDAPQLDFGGTITASTVRSVSPSTSAAVRLPRRGNADPASYLTLNKEWPGWRRTIVDFDAYLEAPSWAPLDVNSGIFSLTFYSDNNDLGIAISAGKDYVTIGTPGGAANGNVLPNDRWFHVHIDMDPTKALSAKIDGEPFTTTWNAQANANPTTRMAIGVSGYNQPAPEYRLNYDNVTVDFP